MQTIYFTTSNFIRHEGNLVDLTEYRSKLARAQGQTEAAAATQRPVTVHKFCRRRSLPFGMVLDCAASIALIVTTLTFAAAIL